MAQLSDIVNKTIRSEIEEFLERPNEIERNVELFARVRPLMQEIAAGLNHFGFSASEMVNFIESHDESRESPVGSSQGRVVQVADQNNPHSSYGLGRGKLFYGLVMYGAATPMILYGQEFATEIGFGDQAHNRIPWDYKPTRY